MPLGSKLTPRRESQFYIELYIRKTSNGFFSCTAYGNLIKLDRNGPWVVPYQNCSNGSDWSWGQKIGLQNAIFKNLLVWNYKAQSVLTSFIASSRGPLPKFFKLCPWGQNWPRPGGHNFTLNYIMKTSNNFLSWTANGNLTKLDRNGRWVVPYNVPQMVLIGCISRSQGHKNRFSKFNF